MLFALCFDGERSTPTCIEMLKKFFNKESEKVCHCENGTVRMHAGVHKIVNWITPSMQESRDMDNGLRLVEKGKDYRIGTTPVFNA